MNALSQRPGILITIGAAILAIFLFLDVVAPGTELYAWLKMAMAICGTIVLGVGIFFRLRGFTDERFILHRLKASRFGLVMGLFAILALSFRDLLISGEIPWDLITVAMAIAAGKVAAMIYFRTNG